MPSHLAVRRLRIRSILLRSKRCVCVSVTADRLLSICLLTYLFNRSITRLYRQFVGGGALLFFWLAIVVVLSRFLVWSNNSTSNRTSSLSRAYLQFSSCFALFVLHALALCVYPHIHIHIHILHLHLHLHHTNVVFLIDLTTTPTLLCIKQPQHSLSLSLCLCLSVYHFVVLANQQSLIQ
jgi:hypothetical protein